MKWIRIITIAILMIPLNSVSQLASYDAQYLTIDVGGNIDYCEVVLEMAVEPDGIYQYFQVPPVKIAGSLITLLLADYQPYILTVKDGRETKKIEISTLGDVIDDRELIIKADAEYNFKKGVLVFNY